MTERPILFSAPMVRALLDGTKTQTRRAMRHQVVAPGIVQMARPGYCEIINEHGVHIPGFSCPYGQPGDRLWVRETWAHGIHAMAAKRDEDGPFVYAATDSVQQRLDEKWTPSIHMPRWASRITLEITGVRVERLQDISDGDALEEGVTTLRNKAWDREHFPVWCYQFDEACADGRRPPVGPSPSMVFRALWESINGPGSWDANPWVWVVEFKRVEGGAA